jgi:adenylate kinase family enzyme
MKRVVILGPGASGKSTLARQLGEIVGLRVVELDKIYWRPGLVETPGDQWVELQKRLVSENDWIMDGDLGPHDAVEVRLRAADTIIFLDFSLIRCAWRALWRSRERVDFWLWLLRYRHQSRPSRMTAISACAPAATFHLLRNPRAVKRFLATVVQGSEAKRSVSGY